jgi:hypothetical protein
MKCIRKQGKEYPTLTYNISKFYNDGSSRRRVAGACEHRRNSPIKPLQEFHISPQKTQPP